MVPRKGPGRPGQGNRWSTRKRKSEEDHNIPEGRYTPNTPAPTVFYAEDKEIEDPSTVEEAQSRIDWPKWERAINDELESLAKRDVFGKVEELPTGQRMVGHRWVLTRKRNANGEVVKYKARLVAKGYNQRPGIDFEETYAPVVDATTFLYVIALATANGLVTEAQDVVTAYLYGKLEHDVYMDAPVKTEGIRNIPNVTPQVVIL
jgi:hypothetical protein